MWTQRKLSEINHDKTPNDHPSTELTIDYDFRWAEMIVKQPSKYFLPSYTIKVRLKRLRYYQKSCKNSDRRLPSERGFAILIGIMKIQWVKQKELQVCVRIINFLKPYVHCGTDRWIQSCLPCCTSIKFKQQGLRNVEYAAPRKKHSISFDLLPVGVFHLAHVLFWSR